LACSPYSGPADRAPDAAHLLAQRDPVAARHGGAEKLRDRRHRRFEHRLRYGDAGFG
jgi:hypothetical protein